jgi:ATP synthase proteolipid subunit
VQQLGGTFADSGGRAWSGVRYMHVTTVVRQVLTYLCGASAVNQTADKPYYLFDGYAHLAAGLSCGLAGLAAGMAIGIVGDAGVR